MKDTEILNKVWEMLDMDENVDWSEADPVEEFKEIKNYIEDKRKEQKD